MPGALRVARPRLDSSHHGRHPLNADTPAWAKDPDVLETLVHRCLAQRDMEGVVHALKFLAVCAPARAELVLAAIKVGIAMRCEPTPSPDPRKASE